MQTRIARRSAAVFAAVALVTSCGDDSTAPTDLTGTYTLVSENDQPLPSDPSAPFGCCLTLGGTLSLTAGTYHLRTEHRNKNSGVEFDNSEQGTYTLQGNTLSFRRTGGGGEGFPYLLGPGIVSDDGDSVMLLYGDEGPGSDQTRAEFER
jgi:hypothetical protein